LDFEIPHTGAAPCLFQARRTLKYDQDHLLLAAISRFALSLSLKPDFTTRKIHALPSRPPGQHPEENHSIGTNALQRENVSVNQIMSAAGLTRGGFYKYFESKSDLYIEVLSCFFTDPKWSSTWKGVEIDLNATPVGPQVVRAYLSRQHFENIDESCPMVALPSDVARGGPKARRAFETVFRAMVCHLQRDLRNRSFRGSATAKAIAALCVGGMVVARAMDDRGLADELRHA
jgi:TetR/AcrR family transcriptional repressor of nem operon